MTLFHKEILIKFSSLPGNSSPPDRDILHTIPQEFIVDTLEKIDNPIGLSGRRLEGHVHLVTASLQEWKI